MTCKSTREIGVQCEIIKAPEHSPAEDDVEDDADAMELDTSFDIHIPAQATKSSSSSSQSR